MRRIARPRACERKFACSVMPHFPAVADKEVEDVETAYCTARSGIRFRDQHRCRSECRVRSAKREDTRAADYAESGETQRHLGAADALRPLLHRPAACLSAFGSGAQPDARLAMRDVLSCGRCRWVTAHADRKTHREVLGAAHLHHARPAPRSARRARPRARPARAGVRLVHRRSRDRGSARGTRRAGGVELTGAGRVPPARFTCAARPGSPRRDGR